MIRTRTELLKLGLTDSQISHRVRIGTYQRVLPQIYALTDITPLMRCQAIAAWQPTAVLSHRTAAWLHGWLPVPDVYEATVPRARQVNSPKWVQLYRRDLDPTLLGDEWALPVTVPAQTLLDCISGLPQAEADLLIDTQLRDRVEREELRLLLASGRRIGNDDLRRQLRLAATRWVSEPERLLAREFHRRGFHIGANLQVGPFWCDFVDEPARFIAEIDGREPHSQRDVFTQDRIRQNWLIDHGWHVRRYSADLVLTDASKVADDVIRAVRRRRRSRSQQRQPPQKA